MHHYAYAEIAPLAPALPAAGEGLAALFPLIAWGICLSLLYVWRRTLGAVIEHLANLLDAAAVHAFGHTIHFLGPVSAGLRDVDGAVQAALDAGARATERATVYLFHKSLATFELVGHELAAISHATVTALLHLTKDTIPRQVHALTATLAHELHALPGQIRRETRAALRPIDRAIGRVEALAHRTAIALPRDIARVGGRIGRAERTLEKDAARLSRVEKLLGLAVFTGLLVRALERLGLKWLRCPSLRNIGKRTGCKGFKLLEDLLFGVIDVLVISDLCRITRLMIDAANSRPIRGALHAFIDGMDDLLRCRGHTRPAKFVVHEVDLPPAQAWAELPPVQTDLPIAA